MVNIKVAVRIRPLSQRELLRGEEVIVRKENKSVLVSNPKISESQDGDSRQRIQRFAVDFCYDPTEPENSSQEAIYNEIGLEVLDSMFKGYNACILTYGHSASGKTYTIMGLQDDPGLTPRLCQGLFEKLNEERSDERIRFQIVISFLEIYNEKVRDLLGNEELGSSSGSFSLRVREHPKLGPYVQGLSRHLVTDKRKLVGLLTSGSRKRITAATENNIHSSRSHAVFTIHFKQSDGINYETEKSSKVHLVDLAGSERASSSQSKARLKEGGNINKSLVTLGNVISALAESCESERLSKEYSGSRNWQPFVPYRDSILTWLLKDTLGGNSNTIMIATKELLSVTIPRQCLTYQISAVSPGSGSLGETVNTLRYAKRTKRIINQPVVNEDPKIRTIRQLRKEIERLRHLLFSFQSCSSWYGSEENNYEGSLAFSNPESKWLDSGGIITIKEDDRNKKENLEKAVIAKKEEALIENQYEEIGKKVENVEFSTLNKYETRVLGQRAASPGDDACKINDAKKSDVNGSFNDNFSHGSLIFSDSLESFSNVFLKRKNSCDVYEDANDDNSGRHDAAEFACESRYFSAENLNFFLTRKFGSYGDSSKNDFSMMLRRSRPDLIKGISTQSKESLLSDSSQSCTGISNLSQSVSENSLNSSSCVLEKKQLRNLGSQIPTSEEVGKEKAKIGAVRKYQEKEPVQILVKKKEKRSEIVDAVTSRLYATKKKSDRQMEGSKKKKEEGEDEELEELKLCRRARMKLFDLSRKLAMTRKIKKTMDNDTQTDSLTATLRFKEKCVTTDMRGLTNYKSVGNFEKNSKEEENPCVIMNQVFIPRALNYVVECGKMIRIEASEIESRYESATQTSPEGRSYKNANTSPIKFSPQGDDCFSEDSLDSEDKSRDYDPTVTVLFPEEEKIAKNESDSKRNLNFNCSLESGFYFPCDSEASFSKEFKSRNLSKIKESKESLFEKMPFPLFMENKISSSEEMGFATDYASNSSLEESRKENNPSSENSLNSTEETDISCSSEATSEDFIFYENTRDFALKTKAASDRELYTITENSEQSDPSDSFSPIQSQVSFLNASNENKTDREGYESLRKCSQTNGFRFEKKIKRELEMFDRAKESNDNRVESKIESFKSKDETEQSDEVFKNFLQSVSFSQSKSEKFEKLPKSISVKIPNIGSKSFDPEPNIFSVSQETKNVCCETTKENSNPENVRIRMDDCKKRPNQTSWKDFQNSSQKQYLNVNISNSCKASPFFVDTHLFGESSQKDQSTDTMFNSADSITFVFMGPAKPKTSVLMEIIQRSLGNNSFSSEISFSQKKFKNKGVPCNENLMRSVSMDTAMIALSRIAKNQEPSITQKSFSLETLTSKEKKTSSEPEKVQLQRETDCKCCFKVDCFKKEKKNSLLKDLVDTNALVDEQTENKTMKNNEAEEMEKTKKSVSWSGESKHLYDGLKLRELEKADKLEGLNFNSRYQDVSKVKTQEFNEENSHKCPPSSSESGPSERRVRFLKPESWTGSATESAESFTVFLKEVIQLLKNLNFCSAKHRLCPDESVGKFHDEANRKKKENDKRGFKMSKNSDFIRKSKTENCLERGESRRLKIKTAANERKMDEGHFNSTWPRRRQKIEKFPTQMKSKYSRSPLSLRSNSFHSNGSLGSTTNSSQASRMASSGQSWDISNLSVAFSNSCLKENQTRPSSFWPSCSNKAKCLRDSYSHPVVSQRSNVSKLNFDSISELELELEECCRRLEMAAEQDKIREKVLENWKIELQHLGHETGFCSANGNTEEKYQATERKAQELIKRRKTGECIGNCTCKKSGMYPCKYLWSRDCRSSFELDSFGPGSAHCQQLCMFCKKKDEEMYYSALCLNSECVSPGLCRLNFYGFCPCSSFRLDHVASSPRAYLQRLLALRRQIVRGTKLQERDERIDVKLKNSFNFF